MSVSKLDELIGLESATRVLKALGAPGSGTHAVLFYGSEGSGKTTLARALTQMWLCSNPTEDGPCGACRACLGFERGNCADFLLVEPQPPSQIIRLNQIHPVKSTAKEPPHLPIQTFLRTSPMSCRSKVVLIEQADRLTGDAANALLKTLEEPNPYAKLILTTKHIGGVLATVQSRCLSVACRQPADDRLRGMMPDLTEEDVQFVDGSVGEALRIKRNEEVHRRFRDFASSLERRPAAEAVVAADEFRRMCEALGAAEGLTDRQAQAEGLKLLTRCIMKSRADRPDWVQATIETHRRIVGNAGAGAAFDALFTGMLLSR